MKNDLNQYFTTVFSMFHTTFVLLDVSVIRSDADIEDFLSIAEPMRDGGARMRVLMLRYLIHCCPRSVVH